LNVGKGSWEMVREMYFFPIYEMVSDDEMVDDEIVNEMMDCEI